MALLTALELFSSGTYEADLPKFRSFLEAIVGQLHDLPVTGTIFDKGDGESLPILEVTIDESRLGRSAFDICRRLRQGTPPVYVSHGRLAQGVLVINPLGLNPERAATLGRRLREELRAS